MGFDFFLRIDFRQGYGQNAVFICGFDTIFLDVADRELTAIRAVHTFLTDIMLLRYSRFRFSAFCIFSVFAVFRLSAVFRLRFVFCQEAGAAAKAAAGGGAIWNSHGDAHDDGDTCGGTADDPVVSGRRI